MTNTSETLAEQCCRPYKCSVCGVEVDRYHTMCRACQDARCAEKEREWFDKAEKLTSWPGPVFVPQTDRYHASVEEYLDYADEEQIAAGGYLWACESTPVCTLDIGRIIEDATQEAYEDFNPDDLDGQTELKTALDAFNDLNKGRVMWEPDYTKAILLKDYIDAEKTNAAKATKDRT